MFANHATYSYRLLSKFIDRFSYQMHNNHLHPSVNTSSEIGVVCDVPVLVSYNNFTGYQPITTIV